MKAKRHYFKDVEALRYLEPPKKTHTVTVRGIPGGDIVLRGLSLGKAAAVVRAFSSEKKTR